MNKLLLIPIFLFCTSFLSGPSENEDKVAGFNPSYEFISSNPVQDKSFYLFTLMGQVEGVRSALAGDPVLKEINTTYLRAFQQALSTCQGDPECYDEAVRFKKRDLRKIRKRLKYLTKKTEALKPMINNHMRPSGRFNRYVGFEDYQLLIESFKENIDGINRVLDIYGLGKKPYYGDIDKALYDVESAPYQQKLQQEMRGLADQDFSLFFEPMVAYALKLMDLHEKKDAVRYEPLEDRENEPASNYLNKIDWAEYSYSIISVFGASPADNAPISEEGKRRADRAVELFKKGLAPLLAFSGGHVRPYNTPFSEAIEMKKYVMEKYGIPEKYILVDPYARHSTSNLRNSARLIYRYGLPTDKKALLSSSKSHISIIKSILHKLRCIQELGYQPVVFHERILPEAIEITPRVTSLHSNAHDPLDP